ncbi:MAG: hypothetical protein NT090_21770 [Acidobacteria bacterium]|nr:hypothetical protein [Acidobacteriota bacterium]
MNHSGHHCLSLCAVAGALLLTASCGSKGPEPPKPGSPAFVWAVAKDSYKAGDYLKTNEGLDQLLGGKSDFVARAAPVKLVLGAGLAQGYIELADKFETGTKATRSNPAVFRKQMSEYRRLARAVAMQVIEAAHQHMNNWKDPNVTFAFPFPAGSAEEAAGLSKVTSGMQLPASEVDKMARQMLQRGVVLVASRVAGFPKDAEKARAAFKPEDTQLPREQFVLAFMNTLYEISGLFGPKKMNEPDRLKMFYQEALAGLGTLPPSKEKKDLTDKIQKALKNL